uniref:Dimer_Tnp_hAT domain-containing protein n=1 Tax=Steinernema glaseri TaxID=37863 RepID=A0A1I7ZJA9_9BILA
MTRKELRVWPISVKANKRSFVFCDASRPSRLYSLPNLLARPELPADRFLQNRTPEKARNGSETFATAVVASYPLGKAKRMFNKLAIEPLTSLAKPNAYNNSKEMWSFFLQKGHIRAHSSLAILVEILQSLPVDTAEVERVFSLFNIVKTAQKSSLAAGTLEATLIVQHWAPENPLDVDVRPFTIQWIRQGHLPSDTPGRTGGLISSIKQHQQEKMLNLVANPLFVDIDDEHEDLLSVYL